MKPAMRARMAGLAALIACAGCAEAIPSGPQERVAEGALEAAVTDELRRLIDEDGRLPSADHSALLRSSEIDLRHATELAEAWASNHAPWHANRFVAERGAEIDFGALVVCGTPLFAASRYERLPAQLPLAFHTKYGSWWLFALCDGRGPAISLAVSATATHLDVSQGRIQFTAGSGAEFFSTGLPADWEGPIPLSASNAAVAAASRSQQAVSELPELIAADPRHGIPQLAMWALKLDSVCLRCRTGAPAQTDDRIFVAPPAMLFGRFKQSGIRTFVSDTRSRGYDARMRGTRTDPTDQSVTTVRLQARSGFPLEVIEFGGEE